MVDDALHPRQNLQGLKSRLFPLVAHRADDRAFNALDHVGLIAQLLHPGHDG